MVAGYRARWVNRSAWQASKELGCARKPLGRPLSRPSSGAVDPPAVRRVGVGRKTSVFAEASADEKEAGAPVENEMFASSPSVAADGQLLGLKAGEGRLPEDRYFRDLTAAILAGETARFEEIVTLFRGRVYWIAWRMAQNSEDALDITQEEFLRTFRALRSWHGRARFSTWLHRIAVNASIDYIRRQAKHRDSTESFEAMSPKRLSAVEAKSATADQSRRRVYAKELRREIFRAVRHLPPRQRRSFVLRYYHECSMREIAAILGITEGAVKRHLHRATRRLRLQLAARLGSTGG